MSQQEEKLVSLFETSWEVCNKVGGIYEVITSKILEAKEEYNDNYYLIGPDLKKNPGFEETDESCWDSIRHALATKDLHCRFGRWDIPGRPKVILVDFASRHNKNQVLFELWERYGVDSLSGGFDYQEPVLFSYTCGEVIAAIWHNVLEPLQGHALAHFHEWMCGAGLLAVKYLAPDVGTVFTTHATMLGRALAGTGVDIYQQMRTINPKQEAGAHGITAKCSMEAISAREADSFTTVSHITADEATAFLGRTPDVITTNGLDLRIMPDYSKEREMAATSRGHLLRPIEKLLRRKLPENLFIMAISGRYEYHNKGIDAFLESLANVDKALAQSGKTVLALCLVMGGHNGLNPAAISGDPNVHAYPEDPAAGFLTPHNVYDQPNDSILNACKRLGLRNTVENNVQVVFVPALLDGNDGFLDMEYFEILAGCDLGVFPSWYEPWGYTPHESAAYGVPTITTDLSGFGIWARDLEKDKNIDVKGVEVLPRHYASYTDVVKNLEKSLLNFVNFSQKDLLAFRIAARNIAEQSTWEHFYPFYMEAYNQAIAKSSERGVHLQGARRREQLARVLTASSSTTPFLRKLLAVAELPTELIRLRELALNMWWCWQSDAKHLFIALNPNNWNSCGHNPILAIEQAQPEKLNQLAKDPEYLKLYSKVLREFDEYMAKPVQSFSPIINEKNPVAYFCCEFGIHESLPIYSGGLGILAGDHMKSVSDLALPVIGVGLLYRNGYFRQKIDASGRQVPLYPYNDFSTLPVEAVKDFEGNHLIIDLDLPGRTLYAAVWLCKVGRAKLYLLDTDISKNTDDDRRITARLYEADRDLRLRQEILLGMGGVRMCYKLGLSPSVFHMNEGHSAFLILERIRKHQFEDHLSLAEAMEFVSGTCTFTTHTPVDAGNERFTVEQIEKYFPAWAQSVGLNWQDFLRLGRIEGHDNRHFDLTVLALRFAYKANGVSWLHGDVSRRMWRDLWKGLALGEVPIGYITNGIHTATFVGTAFEKLLKEYVAPNWEYLPNESSSWEKVYNIPNAQFWSARLEQKQKVLELVRKQIPEQVAKFNLEKSLIRTMNTNLNSNTLLIGFARRFAPYKRATLLFADPERLVRILSKTDKPVVFIFAGKSHPADEKGIDLIQDVIRFSQDPRFAGKVFFLEDYNLDISKAMVQGCDVWLNNPRRPYEASGTSGQKVPVNGGVNFSISDGWWCEGYNGSNGWTIGPVVNEASSGYAEQDDYADAESLYTLLEEIIIPTYYEKDAHGLPTKWIQIAKNSVRTLAAKYSTHRMVSEYLEKYYLPTSERFVELSANKFAFTRSNAAWRAQIPTRFSAVNIQDIRIAGMEGDVLTCGQPLTVEVRVNSGDIPAENLNVQLVIGNTDGDDFLTLPTIVRLSPSRMSKSSITFSGTYIANKNGRYAYGIRVIPVVAGLNALGSTGCILWG